MLSSVYLYVCFNCPEILSFDQAKEDEVKLPENCIKCLEDAASRDAAAKEKASEEKPENDKFKRVGSVGAYLMCFSELSRADRRCSAEADGCVAAKGQKNKGVG